MVQKQYCDSCSKLKNVKRISLGGGAGAFLCSDCLKKELKWRRMRNKKLAKGSRYRTKIKTNY